MASLLRRNHFIYIANGISRFIFKTLNYSYTAFMILTILNGFFCLAFALFAYVNLNDNDAWLWVTIYLVACVCCGLAAFGKYYPNVYAGAMGFYLTYAIKIFFDKDGVRDWIFKYKSPSLVETMQATKPYIEKAREFFGLLIITAALAINYFATK